MTKGLSDNYRNTWFEWKGGQCSLAPPFVIITAYNPEGRAPSTDPKEALAINERANALLREEMNRFLQKGHGESSSPSGPCVDAVIGSSKDRLHQEPSWAGRLPLEIGLKLGRKYRQEALFYIDNGVLYLVGCELGAVPEAVADWKSRQLGG